ncbi:MAG TPA: YlmC/YmxH family sporulation protein [Tenericutes bacterium]|nr:YlmC/YmxH family sporulation protein [Mycoplasmatota bacterium]
MRLSDVQRKDVINVYDGKMIGNVIDINLNSDGKIDTLVVEKKVFILSFFSNKNEVEIKWNQIEKFGEDVILVNMAVNN